MVVRIFYFVSRVLYVFVDIVLDIIYIKMEKKLFLFFRSFEFRRGR